MVSRLPGPHGLRTVVPGTYLYTPAWVECLIEKVKVAGEHESLYEK